MAEPETSILLVEDDLLDAMNVERELRKLGITVPLRQARNGRDALNMLRGTPTQLPMDPLPALVLLDINMPRMNGLELLAELRADPRLRHLQVFIMTTSEEEPDRTQAHQLNVAGYIIKPLTFDRFGEGGTGVDGFSLFVELLKLK